MQHRPTGRQPIAAEMTRAEFLRRAGTVGLVTVGGVPLLAACTSGGEQEQAGTSNSVAAGTLRAWIDADWKNADPGDVYSTPDGTAVGLAYEHLVRYQPDTTDLENWLALEWEPSEDMLRHHFRLREGVLFHGGYGEMTAEDVKYSFERIAGINGEDHSYKADWSALDAVKIDGKYEGTVILKDTYAPLMTTTIPYFAGAIVSQRGVQDLGKDFRTHPVGTGPYEFVEWIPKQKIVFKRFDDYWGDAPAWETIELIVVTEESATEIALETGELDFAMVSVPASERLVGTGDFEAQQQTKFDQTWIGMNMLHPKLEDINVRLAIRYAIDVPGIIAAAFEGEGERATGVVSSSMPIGYWEEAPVHERDLERAQEYASLAAIDGLELEMVTSPGREAKTVAEIVQANLSEIGIALNIVQDDSRFDLGEGLRDLELFLTTYYGAPDPIWATQWFRCGQFDKWNWMYFCSDEYDELDIAAAKELDPEKRQEMYVRMQQIWDEAAMSVWIVWPTSTSVTRTGIEPSFDFTNNPALWNFTPA